MPIEFTIEVSRNGALWDYKVFGPFGKMLRSHHGFNSDRDAIAFADCECSLLAEKYGVAIFVES